MLEGLIMDVASIVIQHPSDSLDPVAEDTFRFRPLNLVRKGLNATAKIRWLAQPFSGSSALHAAERAEPGWRQIRARGRVWRPNNVIFGDVMLRVFWDAT
jgi:hypothetical protein